ncbi:tachykinin-4 isoform X1 [Myotis lucifugus]|uniref:tachykinin-4 isoform X1 n=1 Tax=Myotis lucifugus TaxID=59463 RepID=UPI000CCC348F|nr:tachykinin-4 isoform X1 [Myotis lucifugus]
MSLGGQISWRKKRGSSKDEEQVEPPSPTKEPEGGLACWRQPCRLRGTPRGSQHRAALTMPLCLALLLLTWLSAPTVAGDKKLAPGGTEAGSLVTETLEEGVVPSIQLQLQEVKRDKASQFFPLMGKQAGGTAKQLSHTRTVGSVCSSTEDPTQEYLLSNQREKWAEDEDQGPE